MPKKIQAVILAGGQGSRLRPYTTVIPKPLMPVGDLPIIEIIIQQLKKAGFKELIVSTGYKAHLIEAYLGNGARWGINIQYINEKKPLGTAGALGLIKNLADNFLVINGDVLTDLNFKNCMKFHLKRKAMATISMCERVVKVDFGVLNFDQQARLTDYIEKPQHASFVSMGVNLFNKKALRYLSKNEKIGMPDFLLRLKSEGQPVLCYDSKAFWQDLGRIEDLEQAQQIWDTQKHKFLSSR